MTWRFPVLADARKGNAWPKGVTIYAPEPSVEGDLPTVACPVCRMPRDEADMFDLRIARGMPDLLCTHCLHTMIAKGDATWGALARALGAPKTLHATYDHADTEAVRQGFHRKHKEK